MLKTIAVVLLVACQLVACGGGGGGGSAPASSSTSPLPVSSGGVTPPNSNVLAITVDQGPEGNNVNRLYTAVTICQPGNAVLCQTIDHVLVDTGSTGLRLLSGVLSPSLNLSNVAAASGLPLLACARFLDNTFAWGPVVSADITLGGKSAGGVPVQLMSVPGFNGLARTCSAGTAMDSVAVLGANGIIGLGLFKEDCGASCANVTANGVYFTCTTPNCTAATGSRAVTSKQLKTPIPLFATDNNGFLVDLPAVGSAGAESLKGSLIFGIGTQANNQVTASRVLTTGATGYFSTLLAGQSLNSSFIDTGSNGLYFDSTSIPTCSGGASSSFYCPPSLVTLSATQVATNGITNPVVFSVDNAARLFTNPAIKVLPNLAGTIGNSRSFYWGLPFFYGRRVFTGIEGQASPVGTGPLYAF